MKLRSGQHDDETYEQFSARYATATRKPLGLGRLSREP